MRTFIKLLLGLSLLGFSFSSALAQIPPCPPRPTSGTTITDPEELHSQNGVLTVDLTMRNIAPLGQSPEYCFVYTDGTEAPTLVVNPGDQLIVNLTNQNTPSGQAAMSHSMPDTSSPDTDCAGGAMTSSSTNIHFHGLNVPPKCHGDEVIKTLIQPNDPPFQYNITIPANEPSGLYWYHPHPHGFTATQVVGGAAGALEVAGLEQARPEAAALAERVFVVRQYTLPNGGDENAVPSVNFVPILQNHPATIVMKPSEKQLWRIVNATSIFFLQLQLVAQGKPTMLQLLAVDGVPLKTATNLSEVVIPPAGRAEFIVQGPSLTQVGQLLNLGFNTGPGGDPNPPTELATVIASNSAPDPPHLPQATKAEEVKRFSGLSQLKPTKERHLYFSESDDGTQFFITVAGQTPKVYDPFDPPSVVTQQGAIEDWTIENRSTEVHAFHMHQLHFLVLEQNGQPTNDPVIHDTVKVPYWDGVSATYPSIKVRLDFRDPETVGTFLYHCHILDHEDGGMMAKIKVLPAN
jgi:FtsP/CotA-like multicopper oxidase with cupredoxin domain